MTNNLNTPWRIARNPKSLTINDDQGHIIARLLLDMPEREAQAAVMQAAPDLLEVCKELVIFQRDYETMTHGNKMPGNEMWSTRLMWIVSQAQIALNIKAPSF